MIENHPSRVSYDDPRIYRWKSWDGNTPFAPSWDIPVFIDQCGDTITEDLLEIFSRDTARDIFKDPGRRTWVSYNMFSWDDFILGILCDRIYQVYQDYINLLEFPCLSKDKLWIRGWGVILDKNESVRHHSHAFHENTYLSGNISLSDLDTTTDYFFPYLAWYFGYWKVKNNPGSITLFPSWLEHKVDPNTTGQVRFSLGFDMFTEQAMDYISNNRNESSEDQKIILLSKRMDRV